MVAEENMEYPALLPFQPSNIIYYIPGFVAPRTLPVIYCANMVQRLMLCALLINSQTLQ